MVIASFISYPVGFVRKHGPSIATLVAGLGGALGPSPAPLSSAPPAPLSPAGMSLAPILLAPMVLPSRGQSG